MKFWLALIVLLSGVGSAFCTVLTGPLSYNGHRYYLLSSATWSASQQEAQSIGGNLVTIEDSAEEAWIVTNFSNFGGVQRGLWIGLNDAQNEGSFTWVSQSPSPYRNWASGEPNNQGDEDYAFIWTSNGGKWADVSAGTTGLGGLPIHGVVEIIEMNCAGDLFLSDDFSGALIDASLWQLYKPFGASQIQPVNGLAVFRNRGGLLSQTNFDHAISVEGGFRFTGRNDEFKVVLRSDLSNYGTVGEKTGVSIGFHQEFNLVYIREANRPQQASVNFTFTTNRIYNFRITDDKERIQVYVTDSSQPLLSFWTSYRTGQQIAIYNREISGAETQLENIQICGLFAPLAVYRAIEVAIQTRPGLLYQLQTTPDLVFWLDVGVPFMAGSSSTNVFFRAEEAMTFYRVISR
jgi:hypothetical protein